MIGTIDAVKKHHAVAWYWLGLLAMGIWGAACFIADIWITNDRMIKRLAKEGYISKKP